MQAQCPHEGDLFSTLKSLPTPWYKEYMLPDNVVFARVFDGNRYGEQGQNRGQGRIGRSSSQRCLGEWRRQCRVCPALMTPKTLNYWAPDSLRRVNTVRDIIWNQMQLDTFSVPQQGN